MLGGWLRGVGRGVRGVGRGDRCWWGVVAERCW